MKKWKDTRNRPSSKFSSPKSTCSKSKDVAEISPSDTPDRTDFSVKTEDISEASPYKNFMSEIKGIRYSGNDDFKTPKAFPKCPARNVSKQTKKRSYTRQMKITRMIEKNCSQTDVNSEHLQMAVALSLSEQENGQNNGTDDSPLKNQSLREAFKKFNFNYGKSDNGNGKSKVAPKWKEKRKKSRFQHVTPILLLRRQEDRDTMVASKISLILSKKPDEQKLEHDYEKSRLFSDSLRKYQNESRIYVLNNLTIEELIKETFLVTNLNITSSQTKCGCLLRDWHEIAGRDQSPTRDKNADKIEHLVIESVERPDEKKSKRSISPDLFLSDEEEIKTITGDSKKINDTNNGESETIDISNNSRESVIGDSLIGNQSKTVDNNSNSGVANEILSQSLIMSPKKSMKRNDLSTDSDCEIIESNNGILHYESFTDGNKSDMLECFDLTQSSSSDDESTKKTVDGNPKVSERNEQSEKSLFRKYKSETVRITSKNEESTLKRCNSVGTLNATESNFFNADYDDDKNKSLEEHRLSTMNVDENWTALEDMTGNESKRTPKRCLFKKYHSDMTPNKTVDKENFGTSRLVHSRSNVDITDLTQSSSDGETLEKSLNITDYINKILNKTNLDDFNNATACDKTDDKSDCSQDPVFYISDEELNYSSRMNKIERNKMDVSPNRPNSNVDVKRKNVVNTPDNNLVVKTDNVTPLIDFGALNTPEIHKHLNNYGLKPLKRRRGVEILNYIYETTHPVVRSQKCVDDGNVAKKSEGDGDERAVKKLKITPNPNQEDKSEPEQDWIFERKQSSKIHSCCVPLQVAWRNLVSNDPELHENILKYEPLQLEVLHDMLKEQGFKFHVQDLITFLDKKCITFCTNQNKRPKGRRRGANVKKKSTNLVA